MSWIMKLYETYENCLELVGKDLIEGQTPLLPIFHSTQIAQIEVTLDEEGNFRSGKVLEKKEGSTVIPCTEDSASRAGKYPACHPLFDKLPYLAGDYTKYGGEKGNKFHQDYMKQLSDWCDSPYQNKKVEAVLNYLKKGTLIEDLIAAKALICGQDGVLMQKWDGERTRTPLIFKVCPGSQSDAFVRFRVYADGDNCPELWKDQNLYHDFIQYYSSGMKNKNLCYASGRIMPSCEKHPSKIRNSGDMGKLISANDTAGFTFRGRFSENNQAVIVGNEISQKAHNALKWLIEKQGYYYDGKVILAWASGNQELPSIADDTSMVLASLSGESEMYDMTDEEFARRLNSAIAGYRCNLDHQSDVIIMVIDGATTGRLSITFYREMKGDQFLENIENWHKECSWRHRYKFIDKKRIPFVGAPSPRDIALVAYGSKANDKLIRATIERILPCIVDRADLPRELVDSAVRRASNPVSMESWEWDRALSVACALYRKSYKKEELSMSLDETKTDRSYLYGRMLAVADQIENLTYDKWAERETNAVRYMNVFSQKPFKTWAIIEKNLLPYQVKLGANGVKYSKLLDKINSMMDYEGIKSDKPLDGLYLHGYHCQKQYFWDQAMEKKKNKTGNQAGSENSDANYDNDGNGN